MKENIKLLEAILFIKGSDGIEFNEIVKILKISKKDAENLLNEYLLELKNNSNRGFELKKYGSIYKLVTKKEVFDKISSVKINKEVKLNQPSLEVVTIISYKQPVSRIEVERIRGVSSDYVIKKLLLFDLIEEKGRSASPGAPILYGTTQRFLDKFNIDSLNKLPEFKKIVESSGDTQEIKLFDYD